jgi:hypothetical protein
MRWHVLLAALLLADARAATTAPPAAPGSVHARYVILKGGIEIAEIDEVYTRNAGRYTLTSTAKPLGLLAVFKPGKIFIHSNGMIAPQGLKPLQFSYQREGDSQKDSHADFDWKNRQLSLNHDGQHTRLDLPSGAQDRLSAMYQFMFLHLNSQHTLDFPMTNGSKLDHYHYIIAAGSPFNSSAGRFDTLYLDSQAKTGETRSQIWLATARYNLPCRLIITDPDGGKLTQELRALDIQP